MFFFFPLGLVCCPALSAGEAPERIGFTLSKLKIPLEEIRSGGPPRNGIPSLGDLPIRGWNVAVLPTSKVF